MIGWQWKYFIQKDTVSICKILDFEFNTWCSLWVNGNINVSLLHLLWLPCFVYCFEASMLNRRCTYSNDHATPTLMYTVVGMHLAVISITYIVTQVRQWINLPRKRNTIIILGAKILQCNWHASSHNLSISSSPKFSTSQKSRQNP